MKNKSRPPGLRIRVVFDDGTWIGPGKVELLEGIRETGSIAAAGRRLGMSYKRAWGLVETLNGMFAEPLVSSSRGGAERGGAQLTELGTRVLVLSQQLNTKAQDACAEEMEALKALLQSDMFHGK